MMAAQYKNDRRTSYLLHSIQFNLNHLKGSTRDVHVKKVKSMSVDDYIATQKTLYA